MMDTFLGCDLECYSVYSLLEPAFHSIAIANSFGLASTISALLASENSHYNCRLAEARPPAIQGHPAETKSELAQRMLSTPNEHEAEHERERQLQDYVCMPEFVNNNKKEGQ